ncbi:Hypothetical predicted protein [Podarcis lilfordi]|uniref:Uncharacterized protein n=1 Tax=Podarcis lilfordi TaxID=74358 RepID=A0AA35NZ48_9SAUR|nr:Hypothetical predicted protein [Podarcis lilfordi]
MTELVNEQNPRVTRKAVTFATSRTPENHRVGPRDEQLQVQHSIMIIGCGKLPSAQGLLLNLCLSRPYTE